MDIKITTDIKDVNEIVNIHLKTFEGFFLTFLGKGFLKQLYKGFIEHKNSNVIISKENDEIIGFIAYSENMSAFYKYLIKRKAILFAGYSLTAFLKKPQIIIKLFSALKKSEEVKRPEKFIELASIGVSPDHLGKSVGTQMITFLKSITNFQKFDYIMLETDANNNDYANSFYKKNGFILLKSYSTKEERKMNIYQYFDI